MALDKAIDHGKEHRKRYYGAKSVDRTCRNHGTDDWELSNRIHKHRKRQDQLRVREEDYARDKDGETKEI